MYSCQDKGMLVVVCDREGRIVHFNEMLGTTLGYEPEDGVGRHYWDLFLEPRQRSAERERFQLFRDGVGEPVLQSCWLTVDGDEQPLSVSMTRLRDIDTAVVHIVITAVTRQIVDFERLFMVLPDACLLVDLETGLIRHANACADDLFAADSIVGSPLPSWLIAEGMNSATCSEWEVDYLDETEALRSVAVTRSDVTLPQGDHMLLAIRDVGTKKLAERALQLSEEERVKLEEQLRQAQKLDTVGRLTSGIAQQFNNLLSPVLGYAELAMQDIERDVPLYTDLQRIRDAAIEARDLVRSLLAFSSEQELSMSTVDLNDLVTNFCRLMRHALREDIEIELRLAPALGLVTADSSHIEQVLMSLAVNARDAMPTGGVLTFETENVFFGEGYRDSSVGVGPGAYCMIAVSDTGHGFDEETKKHMFDPFYSTRSDGRQTGLGLSMVHGTIKQHGGHIIPYSERGQGTTFKIYLPRIDEAGMPVQGREELPFTSHGETILVVEDDAIVRRLARDALGGRGYQIIVCATPAEAITVAADQELTIDLLLTDVIMPRMNGKELFERLRVQRPTLRVVYMSGYSENVIAVHGLLERGIEFVQKPFSIYDLNRVVRSVLDRP